MIDAEETVQIRFVPDIPTAEIHGEVIASG
jgi:hypothetical protein